MSADTPLAYCSVRLENDMTTDELLARIDAYFSSTTPDEFLAAIERLGGVWELDDDVDDSVF